MRVRQFIEELMDELRVRHLASGEPHDGSGPLERLDAAYAAPRTPDAANA